MATMLTAFEDDYFIHKVQEMFPSLIERADNEASKYGKTGMEKGSVRKKFLIDFLIDYFGEERIKTTLLGDIVGVDLKINSLPVKIKTITGKGAVKIIWTVDRKKLEDSVRNYTPTCGIFFVRINWRMKESNRPSGLFWIPIEAQKRVLRKLGIENYIKLPKIGTNSRGSPLSKIGLNMLLEDKDTLHIDINWYHSG